MKVDGNVGRVNRLIVGVCDIDANPRLDEVERRVCDKHAI